MPRLGSRIQFRTINRGIQPNRSHHLIIKDHLVAEGIPVHTRACRGSMLFQSSEFRTVMEVQQQLRMARLKWLVLLVHLKVMGKGTGEQNVMHEYQAKEA
mmetsp:Transcript_2745/g.4463  ORF Transcript_2745/g.4463 Transcript_2745/m.4463 type:complete len:100 (-) Transcript_2745:1228-1527(-)